MVVFHCDLDGTLMYTKRRLDLGKSGVCVEQLKGKDFSFTTKNTYDKFFKLCSREGILVIPTTTRSVEQYNRVDFGVENFRYVMVSNGGCLLENGVFNEDWYNQSLKMIENCKLDMSESMSFLKSQDPDCFDVRSDRDLLIHSKCVSPECAERIADMLRVRVNTELLDIIVDDYRVCVQPYAISKGSSVNRFKKFLSRDKTITAGDSIFDRPMLGVSDIGLAPKNLDVEGSNIIRSDKDIFSDFVVDYLFKEVL